MTKKWKHLYLPDTSAILTLLEDEKGSGRVENILLKERVVIPFVVLLEVFYISLGEKGEEIAEKRYAMLKRLDVEYIDHLPEPVLLKAGLFKSRYNISLADSIIAAFAFSKDAVLVHKDPEYEYLKEIIQQERLPYKR